MKTLTLKVEKLANAFSVTNSKQYSKISVKN